MIEMKPVQKTRLVLPANPKDMIKLIKITERNLQ